jgi:MerR family copper efflux transcriptional regulator
MQIGELASRTGVTTKTVRYYESIGLMRDPARTPSGYRRYDLPAVERLRFIRDAQASGLSLSEIQSVLELKDAGARSCEHTRELLTRHLQEIDTQIERLQMARGELSQLAGRAQSLDPAACTDPNRCQVIESAERQP